MGSGVPVGREEKERAVGFELGPCCQWQRAGATRRIRAKRGDVSDTRIAGLNVRSSCGGNVVPAAVARYFHLRSVARGCSDGSSDSLLCRGITRRVWFSAPNENGMRFGGLSGCRPFGRARAGQRRKTFSYSCAPMISSL